MAVFDAISGFLGLEPDLAGGVSWRQAAVSVTRGQYEAATCKPWISMGVLCT